MKEVREDIEKIREDIKKIFGRLPLPPAAMVSESSLKLTELGQKISATLDAKTWAKARAEDLIAKTRDKDAFEIQSMAFEYARNFASPLDMDKKIRDCAFQNGMEDFSVIHDVLGIELRDYLLRRHGLLEPSDEQEVGPEPYPLKSVVKRFRVFCYTTPIQCSTSAEPKEPFIFAVIQTLDDT